MPLDSTGTFRHNHESAALHSKAAGKPMPEPKKSPKEDGESVEGLHRKLSKMHNSGKHFHAYHDGDKVHTYSGDGEGEEDHREHDAADAQGPSDHFAEFSGNQDVQDDEPEEEQAEHEGGLKGLY